MDSVDNALKNSLLVGWGCFCGIPFLFGSCWILTWFFKPGYQELANTSGYGDSSPFIAGAIAFGSLMVFLFVKGKLNG